MRFAGMVVATALMVGFTQACSDYSTGSGGNGGHSTSISVFNNYFNPTPDTVPSGQVTFTWGSGSNGHNVTWLTGPGTLPANSSTMSTGTYQPTLQAGTYTYHCTIHAGMNGTIVVQ